MQWLEIFLGDLFGLYKEDMLIPEYNADYNLPRRLRIENFLNIPSGTTDA